MTEMAREDFFERLALWFRARRRRSWLRRLGSANDELRWQACAALGRLGDVQAVEPLLDRLQDPVLIVRRAACRALGQLGDRRAVLPLLRLLEGAPVELEPAICEALGLLGDERALSALRQRLSSPSAEVCQAAYGAVRRLRERLSAAALLGIQRGEHAALETMAGLVAAGETDLVEHLVHVLSRSQPEVRRNVCLALGRLEHRQAAGALRQRLNDSAYPVRAAACEALGRLGDAASVRLLIWRLEDEHHDVRQAACEALGRLGDASAVEPLIPCLGDSYDKVRQAAVSSLENLGEGRLARAVMGAFEEDEDSIAELLRLAEQGDRRAVGPLLQRLPDVRWKLRRASCTVLGRLGDERAVDPLIAALQDRDDRVRQAACEALGRLGAVRAWRPLAARLEDTPHPVKVAACRALGTLGVQQAAPPLILALGDDWETVRMAAGAALDRLGQGELARAVLGALRGDETAGETLARLAGQGDRRAADPLLLRLGDDNPQLRVNACRALGAVGEKRSLRPLLQCLWDAKAPVQQEAFEAIGRILGPEAVTFYIQCLEDDSSHMREVACAALQRLGAQEAVPPLIRCVGDPSYGVRWAACEALEALGQRELGRAILGALRGEPFARQALTRLAVQGELRSVEPLVRRLEDPSEYVYRYARDALVEIREALEPGLGQLLCRSCLTRFQRRNYLVGRGFKAVVLVVCRSCGRAAEVLTNTGTVVAVLDQGMEQERVHQDGVLQVNWLQQAGHFDFDRVSIVRADEQSIERLCIQVGNDTDPFRRRHYSGMVCTVAPDCVLSPATLNLLQHTFGQVLDQQEAP